MIEIWIFHGPLSCHATAPRSRPRSVPQHGESRLTRRFHAD
jgi:hypothetical protein